MTIQPARPPSSLAPASAPAPRDQPEHPIVQPMPGQINSNVIQDAGQQAAIDAVMQAEALDNVTPIIEQLQIDVAALQATVADHTQQLARLNAAVRYLPCPKGLKAENIEECVEYGLCTCEAGFALEGGTWTPETESAPG